MATAVLMPRLSFRDENSHEDWQVLSRDEPKKKIMVKQTSMMHSEREISMDPKSIKSLSLSPSLRRNDSFDMILLPAMSPPRDLDAPMPLPLQPVRTKFVSRSLPNSTATSPKQRSGQMRSIKSKEQDSSSFRRSKSCGATSKRLSLKTSGIRNSFFLKTESNKSINNNNTLEDGFKCNALCLYLPGFGKGKPVRSSRKDDSSSFTRTTTMTTSSSSSVTVSRTVSVRETTTTTTVISARASMEKFDCGSYTSESGGDEGGGHLFDLPSELIKSGSGENDQDDPVSSAFVFDKEPIEKEIKGVLKISGSKNRKSMESSLRHVRFSTSSPVSYPTSPAISPRLLEATKNFNAFLDAQAI
ncbi:hypothetical protein EUTSA_v10000939mg [Eutrema salsugineum]|uniref:Uncharacterized protein n=2 Tax=Eutrema salsugineum TaxID=72664 RepID=V4LIE7_EUTSA|nr:uncharacterized protein DDB_G0271670 isoform X1 [Eutrema salsugineum]ESQ39543.1 hypothetical protein EUTSA_v10000939mg [Eutrema salsugineum]